MWVEKARRGGGATRSGFRRFGHRPGPILAPIGQLGLMGPAPRPSSPSVRPGPPPLNQGLIQFPPSGENAACRGLPERRTDGRRHAAPGRPGGRVRERERETARTSLRICEAEAWKRADWGAKRKAVLMGWRRAAAVESGRAAVRERSMVGRTAVGRGGEGREGGRSHRSGERVGTRVGCQRTVREADGELVEQGTHKLSVLKLRAEGRKAASDDQFVDGPASGEGSIARPPPPNQPQSVVISCPEGAAISRALHRSGPFPFLCPPSLTHARPARGRSSERVIPTLPALPSQPRARHPPDVADPRRRSVLDMPSSTWAAVPRSPWRAVRERVTGMDAGDNRIASGGKLHIGRADGTQGGRYETIHSRE